jgi:hypothetical protein
MMNRFPPRRSISAVAAVLLLASLLWPARGPAAIAAQCDPAGDNGCPIVADVPEFAALVAPGAHLWLFELTDPFEFTVDLLDPPIDLRLYGYAPDGSLLEVSDRPGRDSEQLAVKTQQVGVYQIFVDSPRGESSPTPYTIVITVEDPRALASDGYEPDDSPLLANPLVPAEPPQTRSFHHEQDNDWVYLDLVTGGRVIIFTQGTGCDPFIRLYGPDAATEVAFDDDSGVGLNSLVDYLVPETETYYARVYPALGEPCGSYQLAAEYRTPIRADAYEPDDTPDQAKPLAFDGMVQSRSAHTGSDVDWVRFTLAAGDAVRINTVGSCDTFLDLVGPDGRTRLDFDDDSGSGSNAQIDFQPTQPGNYFARVSQYYQSPCEAYGLVGSRLASTSRPSAAPTQGVPSAATIVVIRPTPGPGEVVDPFR